MKLATADFQVKGKALFTGSHYTADYSAKLANAEVCHEKS